MKPDCIYFEEIYAELPKFRHCTHSRSLFKKGEEDEWMLESIVSDFAAGHKSSIGQDNWLKSLPERFNLQPAEWSEEDEEILRIIINRVEQFDKWATERGYPLDDPTLKQKPIDWLKNRLKSLRPQPRWKPSEEQMEALRISFEIGTANESWAMRILKSLYNDLKKLL